MLDFHHLNIASVNQPAVASFYRTVLGLEALPEIAALRAGGTYGGDVDFLGDGRFQFHIAAQDLGVGFRTGNAVNPVASGHIAFRTDDIEAFKARLDAANVPYSDYGAWAMAGWNQIFFYDPAGNVIEVHQPGDR